MKAVDRWLCPLVGRPTTTPTRRTHAACIGRMFCAQYGEDFQEYFLAEGQFGVCSKNGCEPLVHALQAAMEQHPDWDFYLVDYSPGQKFQSRGLRLAQVGVGAVGARVWVVVGVVGGGAYGCGCPAWVTLGRGWGHLRWGWGAWGVRF